MSEDKPDINELMDRDPLEYSDQDINAIIAWHRENRHRYNSGDMKAGTTTSRTPKALQGAEELKDALEVKL